MYHTLTNMVSTHRALPPLTLSLPPRPRKSQLYLVLLLLFFLFGYWLLGRVAPVPAKMTTPYP